MLQQTSGDFRKVTVIKAGGYSGKRVVRILMRERKQL
jgi:hypothetical protein